MNPTSALDMGHQARTLGLTSTLNHARDQAILFTTHGANHALAVAAEAVLMLPAGAVVQGPVAQVITPLI